MIVRYDSLNRFETPKFYLCNPGSTYDDGAIKGIFGEITNTSDEELILNFNAMSEFNFRLEKAKRDDAQETAYLNTIYRAVQNRRMIFLDDIGFFVISGVKDGYENGIHYKDVHAESCELEIQGKKIPYIEDGTYSFTNLLESIVAALPLWTIGTVDQTVAAKHRTFEDISEELNCYSFLLENMQDAYECIFVFDCINRVIHVYDQNNYVRQTSIHITKEDVINSIVVSEDSGDLYTAISVLGDEELNIAPINPLGTNVIYNFDYYIPWMSEALQERVNAWKELVAANMTPYYNANLSYYNALTQRSNKQAELARLEIQLTMYRRCRTNITAESDTQGVEGYNEVIISNGGTPITVAADIGQTIDAIDDLIAIAEDAYDQTRDDIADLDDSMAATRSTIDGIHALVAIPEYFTDGNDSALLDELMNYVFEGSYTDEYVTVTDIMTYGEKFQQMKTLYDRAEARLARISQPKQEFDIDVENFLFAKDFQAFSEQLETGCLINAELDDGDVAALFLSTITLNYDDGAMNLTFGNRFNKFDTKSLFENVLGSVQKSAKTLSYLKEILYPIKNGELNTMKEAIDSSRTLTRNAVIASTNEEVVIDDTGYTGRRRLDNGLFDPHQVKITGRNIAFTDDAWQTCKLALGMLLLGDNEYAYGINAETIIGDILMGSNLRILDNNGNDLLTVVDGKIQARVEGVEGRIADLENNGDSVEIRIQSLEALGERDVDHVTTRVNRYTFNDEGLTVHRDGEEIENRIDNTGMYVGRSEDRVLTVNNEGVEAINVKARQFMIVGERARFEPYNTASGDRTACFYIGG